MNFKIRLKEMRKKNGWTQDELAKRLNISTSNISKYESGMLDASTELVKKMAQVFGCTTNYLLGLDEKKEEKDDEVERLKEILKPYERVAMIAIDSGITAEDLEETLLLIKKMHRNKD